MLACMNPRTASRPESTLVRRCAALLATLLLAVATATVHADPSGAPDPWQGFITAPDGVPLCVLETGNPAGRELLFIHGYSQSQAVFKRQFESDLRRDFRIVAFDLRGHGCSGKPWDEQSYSGTRVWADDVAAVIRARGLKRPVIVGWSFGGYISMHYARHHGVGDLAGILLVGSNGGLPPDPTDAAALERLARQREGKRTMAPDINAQIASGRSFVKLMTAQPAPADMQEIMFATNQMLPVYAQRAMYALSLSNQDVIPRLTGPVLFMVGAKDGSQSVDVLRATATQLPRGRVEVMEGTGHAPFIDAPEDFNMRLRAFIAATAPILTP
jgi:non-heme chloroperoxidase